ncbi:succinate dehydrogenase, hydrophobic membrane anchor protein [Albidovulum sp.]|uniref:succinate dehydrogenase, hydrophobic membrane anchor protein n=1 Tax=Albidovulum sp. TaxID=1872424 RepID=UPI001D567841|nr:succinate dehydrogenase, hydrophobic membrane anchor protein [Paracoccaceae bacterium]MCC0046966.1 succinate dehydrogenase, hydrophobic membrane anchor protein [Defluviimonas sp.]HPE27039.1 succinate dehydrogenase, hydrophobic membrane anchor protein [Albidovulum sp.]MCB2120413.1 succinate dehydrogenase, hydrophobic membrane anchor protein [Paracoccaceae bacterium]MCB2142840.1 succinate dehydrogenase, hydrophobic membrane anchor protein [Paracoccaceae bacterium]
MRYLTDRKRAAGLGSAKSGTEHYWHMQVSSVGLAILVPLFIFTFGCILGAPYEEVVAYYGRPFPAIVAGLTLIVGLTHFRNGAQVMIEDYAHGLARKALIVGTVCLSYALMATGLFALIRLAL